MVFFFFSSRRRHTRFDCDWSSDVCSSDLGGGALHRGVSEQGGQGGRQGVVGPGGAGGAGAVVEVRVSGGQDSGDHGGGDEGPGGRSEEHTSELQSQSNLVCRLLLEKKNRKLNND